MSRNGSRELKTDTAESRKSSADGIRTVPWVVERAGNWTWRWRADLPLTARQFFSQPDWSIWLEQPSISVVKASPRRMVVRMAGSADMPSVFCKRFLNVGWADHLRTLLRGSPAGWEASRIELAVARGVRTAPVVGYGMLQQGLRVIESRLLTAAIEPTRSLADLCSPAELPEIVLDDSSHTPRSAWVSAVAVLLADMHGRGLWHGDLHGGNILLQTNTPTCEPWLIDLAALRGNQHCPRTELVQNLARFWLSIERAWSTDDQQRFIEAYWQRLQSHDPHLAQSLGHDIEQVKTTLREETTKAQEVIHRRADSAWERGGSRVLLLPQGRALRGLGTRWIELAIAQIDDWWNAADSIPPWHDVLTRRAIVETPFGSRTLRLIRFPHDVKSQKWTRVRAAWEWGHALHRRGVRVAVPWLYLERESFDELLICEPEHAGEFDPSAIPLDRLRQMLQQIVTAGFSWTGDLCNSVRLSSDGQTLAWCALDLLQRTPPSDPGRFIEQSVRQWLNRCEPA